MLWSPGDQISLFFGSGNYGGNVFSAKNATASRVASFSGVITAVTLGAGDESSVNEHTFTGVYPYRADNICQITPTDSIYVTTTLPDVQKACAGSFDNNTFITIGNSPRMDIAFKSVCSGVTFTLSRDDITSITLEGRGGEVLAGRVRIVLDNGIPVVKEVLDGKTSVTLTPPDGTTFNSGVKYYFVTLPAVLPDGIRMTFRTQYGTGVRNWTTAKEFQRNQFTNWNNINATNTTFSTGSLPDGGTFNDLLKSSALSNNAVNDNITEIRFIAERDDSAVQGAVRLNEDDEDVAPVYAVFSNGIVEVTTTAAGFSADSDCSVMFEGFTALETISGMEKVEFSALTETTAMFLDCHALEMLDLRMFNTSLVGSFVNMFKGTASLNTLVLGDDFTISNGSQTSSMFGGISSDMMGVLNTEEAYRTVIYSTSAMSTTLRNIIPSAERSYYDFQQTDGRGAVLPEGSSFYTQVLGMAPSLYNLKTIRFVTNSNATGTVINSYYGFIPVYASYHDGVVEVSTPADHFETAQSCRHMFAFDNLVSIEGLDKIDTKNATDMSQMFARVDLTSLDLSTFNMDAVNTCESMFDGAVSLKELVLGDHCFKRTVSDPYPSHIFGSSVPAMTGFANTENIKTVIYGPADVLDYVDYYLGYLYSDTRLFYKLADNSSVKAALTTGQNFNQVIEQLAGLRENVTEIRFSTGNDNKEGYLLNTDDWSTPVYVQFDNGVVDITTSASLFAADSVCTNMFYKLTNMSSISGLDKVDVSGVYTMQGMFHSCESLTTLDLSSFNTSHLYSYTHMFNNMSRLSTLILGSRFTPPSSPYSTTLYPFGGDNAYLMTGEANTPEPRTVVYASDEMIAFLLGDRYIDDVHYKFVRLTAQAAQLPSGTVFKGFLLTSGRLNLALADIEEIRFVTNSSKRGVCINMNASLNAADYGQPAYVSYENGIVEVTTPGTGFTADSNCQGMFSLMTGLTSISGLDKIDFANTTTMKDMFDRAGSLSSLDLSSFNTASVTDFETMFSGTAALATLTLGTRFTVSNTAVTTNMFGNPGSTSSMMGSANSSPWTVITMPVALRNVVLGALGSKSSNYTMTPLQ